MNPMFNQFNNMFGNNMMNNGYQQQYSQPNNVLGLISQIQQIKNNPDMLLDILLQRGKINQQQYNELQPYKNNVQQIAVYLANHGKANELNMAQQEASNMRF